VFARASGKRRTTGMEKEMKELEKEPLDAVKK
jgi:hypothetical protein